MTLYNVIQEWPDGAAETMLGCNVSKADAIRFRKKYMDGLPDTNRRRVANGYPPLPVIYSIVTAKGEYADWFTPEIRRAVGAG